MITIEDLIAEEAARQKPQSPRNSGSTPPSTYAGVTIFVSRSKLLEQEGGSFIACASAALLDRSLRDDEFAYYLDILDRRVATKREVFGLLLEQAGQRWRGLSGSSLLLDAGSFDCLTLRDWLVLFARLLWSKIAGKRPKTRLL